MEPVPEAPEGMHILLEIDVQGATAVIEKSYHSDLRRCPLRRRPSKKAQGQRGP